MNPPPLAKAPGPWSDAEGRVAAEWLRTVAHEIAAARDWLTQLDAAIGDGDHGINLDRGFQAVLAYLTDESGETADLPTLLSGVGRTILGSVGGAGGALYGRAFLRAGASLSGRLAGPEAVEAAFGEAVRAIADLGHAQLGEKTMLDALVPAHQALRDALAQGATLAQALAAARDAAEAGARATIPLLARKGRASYLGGRSIGHLDPGAASSAILVRTLAQVVARHCP
jgi:dihydroxyacetone kinase-like protein